MSDLLSNPVTLKKYPLIQNIYYMCAVIGFVIMLSPTSYGMENMSPGDVKNREELPIQDVEKMVCPNLGTEFILCRLN